MVIAGAGPQALTLACLLLQKRPRCRRHLRVFDPSGTWLHGWHRQMERLGIPQLRSPSPHHPHPNPNALRTYAQEHQRSRELEGPYLIPHTALFQAFCRSVVQEFELTDRVQAASLETVELRGEPSDGLNLGLSDGSRLQARRLVIATGSGTPQLPPWVERIGGPYPSHALAHSQTIDLANCRDLADRHVLIVGGGLTSAHLAVGAIRRGARVTLLCRRHLRSKLFDADPGWLGPKYLKAFQSEPCWQRRRHQVLAARDGGSITPQLAMTLQWERQHGTLQIQEQCEVSDAHWCDGHWQVRCRTGSALVADRIWLATGHQLGVSHHPLLRQLRRQTPLELVDDWPVLTSDLRLPGTAVHVMGGLASLRLGPAARNLYGGRAAAREISRALIKG
ncbi:FAD-dependent oxidoreductase [Synechococcus sp. RSCCF101]|nr:FAD-dependent oxidoreductase [Synechococcus sp. RSCCF101]